MNVHIQQRFIPAVSTILLTALAMCNGTVDDGTSLKKSVTYEFTFSTNTEGWTHGFADYPPGKRMESYYELTFLYAQVPAYTAEKKFGLYISGNNHNDDLFMFIEHKFDNLKPDTAYDVTFSVTIASNAAESAVGVNGSPGSSVYLKAGATVVEPAAVDEGDLYRMNIDKGDQAAGGADAIVLGAIGVSGDADDTSYRLKTLQNGSPFTVTTDAAGSLWAIIGTDSGFEGTTSLYYSVIKIIFTEQ